MEVAEQIKRMIARDYGPGDVLPVYAELAERFGVGMRTVKGAVHELARRGIVTPYPRRGTIVNRSIEPGESGLGQVGLVVRCTLNRLFEARYLSEIVSAVCTRLDDLEAGLQVFSLHRTGGPIPPARVIETGAWGVVVLGVFDNRYIAEFAAQKVPMVVLDHFASDIALDYVLCDNAGAVTAIVEHLVSLGHKRIAFAEIFSRAPFGLGPEAVDEALQEESDRIERRRAFLAAAEKLLPGRPPSVETFVEDEYETSEALLDAMVGALRAGPEPATAVVAQDDHTAVRLIQHLGKVNLRVPEDISVAAIAGPDMTAAGTPPLTYCRMDFEDMGRQGINLLELRSRSGPPDEPNVVRIGFDFIRGKTTAPPTGP